ncbi:MAG: HupE/UreJ family protein [Leptothrix ochracea]|uniref:HupE/UreJ family protein n=1 Tax=Leptothrix ochracea TaxID=735331 RepID=UPI0034E2DEE3
MTPFARLAALGIATLLPSLVWAHVGTDAHGHHSLNAGFAAGFTHPFTGLDHLVAMLAVGVWSALATPRAGWRSRVMVPLSFASLLLIGALLAPSSLSLPAVEPMIATSLLVLGLLVATRQALPTVVGMVLVGGFALFHGAAHGSELAGGSALAGMVLATGLLHGAGLLIGGLLRERSVWLARAAGLASAAFGAALLLA